MIREVQIMDVPQITTIYNYYIEHSTATFDLSPYSEEHMCEIVKSVSSQYPYFVYEMDGKVAGYCYAHLWKERRAYAHTVESSVYISPIHLHTGIGQKLMTHLIETCKDAGFHSLIACITEGNVSSQQLHERLGFKQVSEFKEVGFKFGHWLGITDYELML